MANADDEFHLDTSTRFVVAAAAQLTHSELFFLKKPLNPGLTHRRASYEPFERKMADSTKLRILLPESDL